MDAREKLRERNRFEEILPSGLTVTIRPPRIRDCILAGGVPLPVLQHLRAEVQSKGEAVVNETVTDEDAAHMARFQDEIVRRSVVEVEGEPIEMTLEDVAEFSQQDYDRIVELAARSETSPLASAQT